MLHPQTSKRSEVQQKMEHSENKQFTECTYAWCFLKDLTVDEFTESYKGQYKIKTMLADKYLGNDGPNH